MNMTPKNRRRLVIAGAALAVFTIAGFLIAPPIIKSQIEKRVSAELGRRVTVEKVKLNPYALSLTLENFAIQEQNESERFLGWSRLYVNFDALSSLFGEWVLSEVELDGFVAHAGINPDKSFNFSDILARLASTPKEKPAEKSDDKPRPIRVVSLKVTGAHFAFADASRKDPFSTKLGPVTFSLTEFRTVSERGAPYRFEAITEAAEKLTWTGSVQIDPLRSSGQFSLENLVLAKYAPYYSDQIGADITTGTLSVQGEYELSQAANQGVIQLKNAGVGVRSLRIVERATRDTVIEIPDLSVTGITADALAMKATIAAVALNGGSVRARREKDGSINLLTMLVPKAQDGSPAVASASSAAPATSAAAAPRPEVTVADVSVKDMRVDVTDLASPRPAQLGISNIQASLKNVTLTEGAQIPVQLSLDWSPKGTVRLAGTVALSPVQADLKVDVADIELLPLSPYVEQFVNARLTQGAVTAGLDTHAQVPTSGTPVASVSGDVRVDKLGLVDSTHNEELAGVGSLNLRGLRASSGAETRVSLEEIALTAPFARLLVNADKTINVTTVMKSASTENKGAEPASPTSTAATQGTASNAVEAATSGTGTKTAMPIVEIGRIVISDGDFRFSDRSIEPNVRMAISEFGGTIGALSSAQPAKGDVNLKAVVDGAGPIAIVGRLDPLSAKPTIDLKVDFKNIDLLPLSPYSGRFAGYELARGKLVLDVKLLVDGKKLDSANVITLNQFTFGNAVQSPEATKLPVRLGVALLKDLDGKIVIDVPVQGNLDDPSFRVGRVVLRVVVNLLTKAAVSPFTLLGAAFGGGGEELAFQEFAPGSSELQESERAKLTTMITALTNRPGLSLGLEGNYDTAADTYALKRQKFAEQVRRAIWENKRQTNPNIPPPAELVITPEENVAMIKKLFDEKFPPGTEFGAPVPPAPTVVAAPEPPRGGFVKRVVRLVTLKSQREQRAQEREKARATEEHTKAVEAAKAAGLPLDDMTARLAETVTIDENDLRALAEARAQRVRDYFASTGKIAGERLYLTQPKTEAAPADAAAPATHKPSTGKGPRVFLTLQ